MGILHAQHVAQRRWRMIRPVGWAHRLSTYIMENRNKPFVWGERDCMLFAAGAYKAIYDIDLAKDYRGYSTEKEARRIIQKFGGVAEMVDTMLKRKETNKLQTGDIGFMIHPERGEYLTVIYNRYAIAPSTERALMSPTLDCEFGWDC